MKKILHMTPPIINNGVYRYIFNHMKYIDQNEYQFEFLTRNEKELKATKEYQRYLFGVQVFQSKERESKIALQEEIIRILSRGYDVIHLHTSFWRGFLIEEIAMEMKINRVIVHSHSSGIDFSEWEDRKQLLQIHEQYKRDFDLSKATDLCACSKVAGEWLYGPHIPRKKIKILPNAIEVEKYHYRPEVRENFRRKLGVEDKIIVGSVGRFCYSKNYEFLVKIFAKAVKRNKKLVLLLIGGGELERALKNLADKLGIINSVFYCTWQNNVEDYLQAMDIFCLPSIFEGLPISIIEAQAAGLKCLVSDTVTEEVKITNLVKFLPLIEEEWSEALVQCTIDSSRERMDELIAKRGFDLKEAVGQLTKLYDG